MLISSEQMLPKEIEAILKDLPGQIYLVGGAVRDCLQGESGISDWDFVVFGNNNLAEASKALADKYNMPWIELDKEFGHYRIIERESGVQIDLTMPRGETLEQDLQARDYTINAIAYDIQDSQIIDPLNGQQDLKDKIIRSINIENLKDDKLRILRAYRFAAQINATLYLDTQEQIREILKEGNVFSDIAKERISTELWKLLSAENSFIYLKEIFENGLLEEIIPEMSDLRKVPGNSHHHLTLPEHTLELIKQYETVVKGKISAKHRELISGRIHWMKMACLLHDISKPETWVINDEGRHTFYDHDKQGAEKSKLIGRRLKWSSEAIDYQWKLVRYHLAPFQISNIKQDPSEKAINRLIRRTQPYFVDLIALAWSDMLSVRGEMITEERIVLSECRMQVLLGYYDRYMESEARMPALLQGDILEQAIQEAGLAPTKLIKELLEDLRDLQMSGEIINLEQAREWFIREGKERNL